MPIVLAEDLNNLIQDKADDFKKALGNPFTSSPPAAPTPSSDSLTNPLGTGNGPVSPPAPDAPVTAPLTTSPAPAPQPDATPDTPPDPQSDSPFQQALAWGKQQIGKAYIWGSAGGRSDLSGNAPGFDCSGFVAQFYHQMGLSVPAQTASAYAATKPLSQSDARPGDIVEFNMGSNDPHEQHIAIYLGNGQVLQSGGTRGDVNIGTVDQFGPGTFEFRRADGADKVLGNTTASSTVANTAVTVASQTNTGNPLRDMAASAATKAGVPVDIFNNLVGAESSWNPAAVSKAGAQGLTQLEPDTAKGLGVTDPFDPKQNLEGGAQYLQQLFTQFGNWRDALIAYNEGPGRRSSGVILPESANYADGILGKSGSTAPSVGGPDMGGASPVLPTQPSQPAPQSSPLDQAQAFKDSLGNPFQSATNAVGNGVQDVVQQAQSFKDSLGDPFKSATDAIGNAAGAVDSADKQYGPNALLTSGEHALGQGVQSALSGGIQQTAANDLNNGALGPMIPQPVQSAAASLVTAPGVLDNLQTISSLAQQHPDSSTMGVLPDTSQLTPDESSQYQSATVGVGGIVGEPGGSSERPLFGRGGVPGGTGERPTMPAPTQPQDLETALAQSQVQATLKKIQGMGYSPDEAAGILRNNGVPEEHIQTALNPPTPVQVPTSVRPPTEPKPSLTLDTSAPDAPPHVTYDPEGNVVSGTPSEPPTPPTPPDDTTTLPPEPAPDGQPLRGAAANQQPKNLLQRAQSAVGDVLNPAANAPKPVQEALQKYIGTKNLAVVQVERQVDAGLLDRASADQAIGQAKGAAQTQFLNDIRNSPEGVELKSVLAQHGSIDSQGENVVGNPKPAGWVDGDSLGIHGTWVSPEIATVVKNTLAQGDSVPILSGVAAVQGQLKQLVLNSPFHAFQEAFQAVRLGAGQLDAAGTKDMLGASTLNAVNPGGFKAYMAKPETQSIVDRLVQAGGTLRQGEAQDFFNAAGLKGMAVRGGLGGALSGGTTYVNDKAHGDSDEQAITDALTHAAIGAVAAGPAGSVIGKAIFNRQIPTLKIEGFRMLTENGISDQSAAAMVNQTFGGNNLQVIARSPLVQTLMRSTLLAPDWWEGFGRNFLSAIPGAPVSREMGGLARRQVAATAVTAAFTLEGLNLLTTGHLSNQNQPGHELDLEIPHSMVASIPGAPQGTDGQMDHIDVLGPIKTMASALSTMPGQGYRGDAGNFVNSRLGEIPSEAFNLHANENPATGKPIVPPGSDPLETVGAVGGYAAGRTLPIGSTSADQGAKVSGPIGGAAEYVTGMRQTSETPDQASSRSYYANLDKAKADMHDWLQQQPEYQQATPAAQRSMQAEKDIELEKYLREQNNVAPLDKGMPAKYIGVDDPRQQVQIDEAKARVDAYKRDSLHSPRPSTEDYVLAAHSVDWRYTQASKARGVSNKTLDQRFQSAFTAPTP